MTTDLFHAFRRTCLLCVVCSTILGSSSLYLFQSLPADIVQQMQRQPLLGGTRRQSHWQSDQAMWHLLTLLNAFPLFERRPLAILACADLDTSFRKFLSFSGHNYAASIACNTVSCCRGCVSKQMLRGSAGRDATTCAGQCPATLREGLLDSKDYVTPSVTGSCSLKTDTTHPERTHEGMW